MVLIIFTLLNLINYIDRLVIFSIQDLIKKDFTLTDAKLGLLASAFMVCYMVAALILGWLGDRFNRKYIVFASALVWSIATFTSGLMHDYTTLLITRMIVGIGEAAYTTIVPSMIGDYFRGKPKGKVLSIYYVVMPLGGALSYLVGGNIGPEFGWQRPFQIMGVIGIPLAILLLFIKEPARENKDLPEAKFSFSILQNYKMLLQNKAFIFVTLGMAAYTFTMGGLSSWMPSLLHRYQNMPLEKANNVFGIITVVASLTGVLGGGIISDYLRSKSKSAYFKVSGWGCLLAIPFGVIALIGHIPVIYPAIFIGEFFLFMVISPTNAILLNCVQARIRASAFAVNILVIHLMGDSFAPPIIGKLSDITGNLQYSALIAPLMLIFAVPLLIMGAKYYQELD